MLHPYTANTSQGMRLGKPGTYLVQEVVPQGDASVCYQHWLGPQAFRNVYAAQNHARSLARSVAR